MSWTICIDFERRSTGELPSNDRRVEVLSRVLAVHSGAAFGDNRRVESHVVIPQRDPVHTADQASIAGVRLFEDACRQVGITDGDIVNVECIPELIGAGEVAAALRVSRQRLHELRVAGRFPPPVMEVASSPVWRSRTIGRFDSEWQRRPGSPPSARMPFLRADG